jgi:hypothetical protein
MPVFMTQLDRSRNTDISQRELRIGAGQVSSHRDRQRLHKRQTSLEIEGDVDGVAENVLSDYESDCIVVATKMNQCVKPDRRFLHHIRRSLPFQDSHFL